MTDTVTMRSPGGEPTTVHASETGAVYSSDHRGIVSVMAQDVASLIKGGFTLVEDAAEKIVDEVEAIFAPDPHEEPIVAPGAQDDAEGAAVIAPIAPDADA